MERGQTRKLRVWLATNKGYRVGLGSQTLVGRGEQEARQQGTKEGEGGQGLPTPQPVTALLCVLIYVDTCN